MQEQEREEENIESYSLANMSKKICEKLRKKERKQLTTIAKEKAKAEEKRMKYSAKVSVKSRENRGVKMKMTVMSNAMWRSENLYLINGSIFN